MSFPWNLLPRATRASSPIAMVACATGACGGEVEGLGSKVEPALCVAPTAAPGNCKTSWQFVDPCNLAPTAAVAEVVVFPVECPESSTLASGGDSEVVERQVVPTAYDFEPIDGLTRSKFGFAFLLRNNACKVMAFGCTNANLDDTTKIITAVRPDSAGLSCEEPATGSCPGGASCNAGVCD